MAMVTLRDFPSNSAVFRLGFHHDPCLSYNNRVADHGLHEVFRRHIWSHGCLGFNGRFRWKTGGKEFSVLKRGRLEKHMKLSTFLTQNQLQ